MRILAAMLGCMTTVVLWVLAYLVTRMIPSYTFGSESTAWEELLGVALFFVYMAGFCAALYVPVLAGGWVRRTVQRGMSS